MAGRLQVRAREAEEARQRLEERKRIAAQIEKGIPLMKDLLEEEAEEVPDGVVSIPYSKVKLVVGPGGAKIKEIEKKSGCRVQVTRTEEDLNRAFGESKDKDKDKAKNANELVVAGAIKQVGRSTTEWALGFVDDGEKVLVLAHNHVTT